MKNKTLYLRSIWVLLIGIIFLVTGCLKKEDDGIKIPAVLSSQENLSTFVSALDYVDLTSALEDYGPLTVFAPSNDAFAALFNNLGVNGIEDISVETLDSILLFHILSGKLTSDYFATGYLYTLSAGPDWQPIGLQMKVTDITTLGGSVNITKSDITASNGVIHIINEVLIPPTVMDLCTQNTDFSLFAEAINKAGLSSVLNRKDLITVFVPTNEAFELFFTDLGVSGLSDLSKEQLIPILQSHIVDGNLRYADLVSGNLLTHYTEISVEIGTKVVINGSSNIIGYDLQGKNGVVHVIDKVIVPAKK